jgi:dGTPase
VDFYVQNYISSTALKLVEFIKKYSIEKGKDFHDKKTEIWKKEKKEKYENIDNIMSFDGSFKELDSELEKLSYKRIINSQKAKVMDGKGDYIIRKLFEAYLSTPNQLPDNIVKNFIMDYNMHEKKDKVPIDEISSMRDILETNITTKKDNEFFSCLCRNICDYIASMTDRYALKQYEKLYGFTNIT